MNLNFKKIYSTKIISIFYILLPIIEVITTFTIINSNLPITLGMVYKSIFTIYAVIYLLFVDIKHKKKNYLIIGVLFIYTLISLDVTISGYTLGNIFEKFTILSRFICFPVITLFLYRFIKNGNKLNLKLIVHSGILYGLAMFLAGITGTALASYSQGLVYGNCGWFYSGNEISNLLSMFYPIIIYYIAKEKSSTSIIALTFVTYGLLVIGTKTSLFALVIVTSTMFLFSLIVYSFRRNNISRNICIICILLGVCYFYIVPCTPAYKFMIKRYGDAQNETVDIEDDNNNENGLNKFIYNGREIDLNNQKEVYKNSSVAEKLFGINDSTKTLTDSGEFNVIERDFYDVLFIHGILGLIIFFIPLILVFYSFIRHVFKNFELEVNNNKFAIGSSIAIAIGISYIAGHVFLASTVAMYLALICVKLSIKEKNIQRKKDMIIYMPKLSAGGMEISLINFLNISRFVKEFNVTLCLGYVTDKKYLDMLPKNITVRLMTKGKFDSFGKFKSALKYIVEFFKCLDKNYDMSICYSYHHKALSILARLASHNSIIFMHTDLINSRTPEEITKLNKKVNFQDFRVIACVSKAAENSMLKLYPSYKGKVLVINNYVDGDKIFRLANEQITTLESEKNVPIFINVSRHFEKAKKISRIIDAAEALKNDEYKFIVWLVGDGEDTDSYKDMVSEKGLEDIVIFKGRELNPYKYIKRSNCLVVSSDFEGYGMVIDEARVLGIPVISTDVGDAKEILSEGYGIVCGNSYEGIYETMKEFLESRYTLKQKFSYEEFNKNIDENLYKLKEYFGIFDRKEEE